MRWTPADCYEKFRALAHETFGKRKNLPQMLDRMLSIMLCYLDDCQYKSIAIEAAFNSSFGPPPNMFNPLSCDTKVAVIAAPVKGKTTSVICNYNGKNRPTDIGYRVIRAMQRQDEITLAEA